MTVRLARDIGLTKVTKTYLLVCLLCFPFCAEFGVGGGEREPKKSKQASNQAAGASAP